MSQRILIVDDSEKSRILLKQMLSTEEYEIYTAEDSFEAMEFLDKFDFDLLMLDLNLPFKDGFSTLKTLKDTIRFKMLPVAIITGRNTERDVKKAISLGASSYIVKPFRKDDVLEKVQKILDKEDIVKLSYNLDLPKTSHFSEAKLEVSSDIEIVNISDSGIVAITSVKPGSDAIIKIDNPAFRALHLESPRVKVNDIKQLDDGKYRIRFVYIGLKTDTINKLRNWLLTQASTARRA